MTDDKTVEAAAKAYIAKRRQSGHMNASVHIECIRAAIEAHEAAKGEEPMRCLKCGRVANVCRPDAEDACTAPDPLAVGETEREALADLADDIIDRANIEDVNPGSVAEVIEAVVTEHGFRRHPTPAPALVETVEELEALRLDDDTVLQGHDNGPYVERALMTVRYHRQWRKGMIENGGFTPDQDIFPATVLTPALAEGHPSSATVSAERVKELSRRFVLTEAYITRILRAAGLTVEEGN